MSEAICYIYIFTQLIMIFVESAVNLPVHLPVYPLAFLSFSPVWAAGRLEFRLEGYYYGSVVAGSGRS